MAARKSTPKKRRGKNTWKKAFLATLALYGNVTEAAGAAGIDPSTAHHAKEKDEGFSQQWNAALDQAADRLEREAVRRAYEGVDEPVFGSGGTGVGTVEVGKVRKYSDTLLIFLLKGCRPEKFREKFDFKHGGRVGVIDYGRGFTERVLADPEAIGLANKLIERLDAGADGPCLPGTAG